VKNVPETHQMLRTALGGKCYEENTRLSSGFLDSEVGIIIIIIIISSSYPLGDIGR
jgi:hypothetical protein